MVIGNDSVNRVVVVARVQRGGKLGSVELVFCVMSIGQFME